jgi:hypothetical protein
LDDRGAELHSLVDARRYAASYASDLLRDQPDVFWGGEEWRMDIADENGLVFSTLIFLGIDAPAAGTQQRKKCK